MRFTTTVSLVSLAITWAIASHLAQSDAFPSTCGRREDSGKREWRVVGSLGRHIWKGRRRVWPAWAVGIGIGAALGRSDRLDRWFWPWLNTFLNMPALVIIVICYLGLGMSELAAVLAVVINKAPLIATNVRDGVRQFETRYDEFASIYRLSWTQKVRLIWLPQLEPFLFTA